MFFKKSKELKKQIEELKIINEKQQQKCSYYQEQYLKMKSDYIEAIQNKTSFTETFTESFTELSAKLILVESTLQKIENKEKNTSNEFSTENFYNRIQEIESDITLLFKELNRLTVFLEKHTHFNSISQVHQFHFTNKKLA
ncbi:MAG: hypothetical protein ACRCYT_08860 [Cetobacterium sp.]